MIKTYEVSLEICTVGISKRVEGTKSFDILEYVPKDELKTNGFKFSFACEEGEVDERPWTSLSGSMLRHFFDTADLCDVILNHDESFFITVDESVSDLEDFPSKTILVEIRADLSVRLWTSFLDVDAIPLPDYLVDQAMKSVRADKLNGQPKPH